MWDAEEHVLLQSVLLESPPGRRLVRPEFGRRSIVTSTPHHRAVLVLCSDLVNQLLVRRPSRQRPGPDGAPSQRRTAERQVGRAGGRQGIVTAALLGLCHQLCHRL